MTVFFTDIVGSTAFFEQRGDVEGLALVHRHNDLLFPIVPAHGGRIIKTIGDAIMAVFDNAEAAVAAACAMQRALVEEAKGGKEPIHIRIGLHTGAVLKDKDDVYGDTVNVAARVNAACAPDEILVTEAVCAALPQGHDLVIAERPPIAAKGKAEPVPARAIIWRDSDAADERAALAASKLFMLSIERGPAGLRVSAMDGDVGKGTLNRHVDVDAQLTTLDALVDEVRLLCHDGGQKAYASALHDKGKAIAAAVIPAAVQAQLLTTPQRALRLHLDEATARLPLELAILKDGGEPLGCAFAVGRVVSAADVEARRPTDAPIGTHVVVIADPSGDLAAAREEGELVAKLYDSVGASVVRLIGPQSCAAVKAAVADAAIVHIAAHVERGHFGVVCQDGVVEADDLAAAFQNRVPGLVVANACHASIDAPWAAATFTRGLLDAGVSHVVAPLWAVPDKDALAFALRFTETALAGIGVGEAVRRARLALKERSAGPLAYAGYVLFGDPRHPLPLPLPKLKGAGRTRSGDVPPVRLPSGSAALSPPRPPTGAPIASPSPSPSPQPPQTKSPLMAAMAIVVAVAAVAIAVAVARQPPQPPQPPPATMSTATPPASAVAPPAAPVDRTGPVRVSVLPFKGQHPQAAGLGDGVAEAVVTELAGSAGIKLIERGQIDVDIGELDFQQSKYVDPQTRAAIGKIGGAELVVLGSVTAAGDQVRLAARFVDVETGEVLATAKADGVVSDVFALQDRLAADVKRALPAVKARVRP